MNNKSLIIVSFLALSSILASCVPVVASGVAVVSNVSTDRRSAGTMLDDNNIAVATNNLLSSDERLSDAHLNVNIYKGAVLLTGEVPSQELSDYAEQLLRDKYPSIVRIHNELSVMESASIISISKDVGITSAVLLNFQNQEVFHPNHVKVVTERGVVYLLGAVTRREGDMAAKLASQAIGVKQVVVLFEYLAQKPQSELDEEARIRAEREKHEKIDEKINALEAQKQEINQKLNELHKMKQAL